MANLKIRPARTDDAQAVCDIYAFHVAHSTATFDIVAPDVAAWANKIAAVAARGWPFLVAERDEVVAGYCYATQFRDRAAYAKTCENSIYVAHAQRGRGIGSQLLGQLVRAGHASGFEQMIAVIGGGEAASVALHTRCGFIAVGRLRNVGCKLGRKLDTVYMQCDLTTKGQQT